MRKIPVIALWLSSGPISAQELNAQAVTLTEANASIAVLGLTVEQTVGMEVFDETGAALGKVVRVIGDDQDTPTGLVLSAGGSTVTVELANAELINSRIVISTDD